MEYFPRSIATAIDASIERYDVLSQNPPPPPALLLNIKFDVTKLTKRRK